MLIFISVIGYVIDVGLQELEKKLRRGFALLEHRSVRLVSIEVVS
jgi:hypothetical protein